MLLSMTGFGEAHCEQDGVTVSVEVRTINNRYLKTSIRLTEGYAALEPQVEAIVRKRVRRGTIQVNVRISRAASPEDYGINVPVLDGYRKQLADLASRWDSAGQVPLRDLLPLPGVVTDRSLRSFDADELGPQVDRTLEAALANLNRMRQDEGRTMGDDLQANCRQAAASLAEVEKRAPLVVEEYRNRLSERLNKTLTEFALALDPADVLREVSLFADRADISEEIVRLRSHLEQFEVIMGEEESSGRKLEFLAQEMVREGNTIGSKGNDVEIARHVIEIKAAIERIREMVQNVE